MVYMITCACVDYFSKLLQKLLPAIPILSLHGKVPADKRTQVFNRFKSVPSGVLLCTDVAARGLDIPNVDWVVQYDPPQDPAAFVHRCGRTARLGRDGKALVFLHPAEDSYVNFLEIRKIPIQEMADPAPAVPTLELVRKLASTDREIYDKGRLAFVTYIRGYKEHQCGYIFRMKVRCAFSDRNLHSRMPLVPPPARLIESDACCWVEQASVHAILMPLVLPPTRYMRFSNMPLSGGIAPSLITHHSLCVHGVPTL
jgi:hypothetical protein